MHGSGCRLHGMARDSVSALAICGGRRRTGLGRSCTLRLTPRTGELVIPPGRNALPRPCPALRERNRDVRSTRALGRREWYARSGYSRRSMVENTFYRYKTIIGRQMRSRGVAGQRVEVKLACGILNTMTELGMPESYRVE